MEPVSIDVMADRGVAAAFKKLQTFNGELADFERRIVESNSAAVRLRKGARIGPIDRAAKALVDGKTFKDLEADTAAFQSEYPKLCERRAVVAKAIEMQKKVLSEEEARASRDIVERVTPEYRAIVAGLGKSMIRLGKAMVDEIFFFEALRDAGVTHGSLTRMNVTALGDPRDRNSRLAMWIMEAISFGLIDEGTVPAEWRERWNK